MHERSVALRNFGTFRRAGDGAKPVRGVVKARSDSEGSSDSSGDSDGEQVKRTLHKKIAS